MHDNRAIYLNNAAPAALRKKGKKKDTWYNIAVAGEDTTEVMLCDNIGAWGISASQFARDLNAITTPKINLRINSDGGEIFDGLAIANTIRNHSAEVTGYVDSLAASIATVVAVACDHVCMARNAFWMIHNGVAFCFGDARELRRQADILDKLTTGIAQAYVEKTGRSLEEIQEKMDVETWFSAEEALEFGFIDEIDEDEEEEDGEPLDKLMVRAAMKFKSLPSRVRSMAAKFTGKPREGAPPAEPLNKEPTVAEKLIARDGKHFVKVGDKEIEVDVPQAQAAPVVSPAPAAPQPVAQVVTAEDAVKQERTYRKEFMAALSAAGIKDKAAEDFETAFYGRPIADVKFLASNAIGTRATPVGEAAAADPAETPESKAQKAEKVIEDAATKRFNTDPGVRLMFNLMTSNPEDPKYKAALARYVAQEKKWAHDQQPDVQKNLSLATK